MAWGRGVSLVGEEREARSDGQRGRAVAEARAPINFHNDTIPSSCPALAYSSLISFSSFNTFSMIVVAHKLVFA